ncbi:MAG: carbohydrate ABC transporter permease [Chloroflexi bacterium]|nr:carbohydrate ABC transporter permease [Chloroflexota bacterium]
MARSLAVPTARSLSTARAAWLPKRWYIHALLWLAIGIIGFPLFYALTVSTQTNAQVFRYQLTPGNNLIVNWNLVMGDRFLWLYMLNSFGMAVSIAIGKTLLSLLAGLAFVYFRFPGKWLVFGFVLLTLMMPTEVIFIALFRFVSNLEMPAYLNLVVPFLASATGTFLFRQHFASIPAELSEAAQLDGATPLDYLFRVLVPISWNTIGALVVIQFLYAWNMYLWPRMIITSQETQVVQVGLRTLLAVETGVSYGPLMLAAVLASIPPVLIFVLLQKQFMSGFSLTRDK